jgi:tRNA G18 (ribose-2'-O)-methylase SpoU
MSDFVQRRHKPPVPLQRPRELLLACPPMRSNVNLSRIVRAAACCGIPRMVCCGNARILPEISRETGDSIQIEIHRTLPPVLKRWKQEGYPIVGLEQASNSTSIFEFPFPRKVVLVIGNERLGIEDEVLRLLDGTIEIPVYGLPYAHNAATATAMALYEYCRQYPAG